MSRQTLSTEQIKSVLLEYHRRKGYEIFKPFSLVSSDPTVMFINATITPFKAWFTDVSAKPRDYALVQNCLRLGGASELELAGTNPYYHTFFEMFGSGTFTIAHKEAVRYLLELLNVLGLERNRVYFTIPAEEVFHKALEENGIKGSHVFTLKNNDLFWQEWKFGKAGPVGRGLTVIYSRADRVWSVHQMAADPNQFVELLNLIHIYGQETRGGSITAVAHPGFDLGIGIERLAAVLQGCNNYQIDSIRPLTEIVRNFLSAQSNNLDETVVKVCTDHLRAICILISEGLSPSNKEHGYVLRKLIRRFLEFVWIGTGKIMSGGTLVEKFADQLNQYGIQTKILSSRIVMIITKEGQALKQAISRGGRIVRRQPHILPEVLRDTYGVSLELIHVQEKEKKNENDKR